MGLQVVNFLVEDNSQDWSKPADKLDFILRPDFGQSVRLSSKFIQPQFRQWLPSSRLKFFSP